MVTRARWVKLANRQAGYLSSLSLIRAGGTQRASCSARPASYRWARTSASSPRPCQNDFTNIK
ncbi:hypothetical protein DD235_08260 [Corticimicrobacter populi]|uniref:Uncharacterized protein n=1 Tax=Corticimicrobacter populi TaxID=2175229 RepID=A0A2V1K1E5_9BURK|nr:hypothetical protein DD235_08260 [Corticimicrobacter populi]